MLHVKTYLDKSTIHGTGLFAKEFIPKGTKVWDFTSGIDQIITDELIAQLTEVQQEYINTYSYRSFDSTIILCCDDARYFNYSSTPNCAYMFGAEKYNSYAIKNIDAGEELTFPIDEDLDADQKLDLDTYTALTKQLA